MQWADGIVITPSHNPPEDGGFKYNPPNGGPADTSATRWIEDRANQYITDRLTGVERASRFSIAIRADTTHRYDYITAYVDDLRQHHRLRLPARPAPPSPSPLDPSVARRRMSTTGRASRKSICPSYKSSTPTSIPPSAS